MKALTAFCPKSPDWNIDWEGIDRAFPWIQRLRSCPQDSIYHQEGDVWIHTRMVVESLAALDSWRTLPDNERVILFSAALLHDVAKPSSTRLDQQRITSRGHSLRGAIDARCLLWEMGAPFAMREQICALVEHHQAPFNLIERDDAARRVFRISQTACCGLLAQLARADALGRVCDDQEELLGKISLFEELCREYECLELPCRFPSAHSRFEYFRSESRSPEYLAHEDFSCRVTVLSGLPGAGKDTWISRHMPGIPLVSLDALRAELDEDAAGSQGRVVQAAREMARKFLRRHEDFVWNATNLSRDLRTQVIDLLAAYRAHVRIVYVEAAPESLVRQNKERTNPVPTGAIERMLQRWQVPSPIEAQEVEYWIEGKACAMTF
ncbi:MAG: AAA family ATPase [Terracidiphilus sp.]|jgi:predicted kinase